MRRVAALGLDAAEWAMVERLIAEGELPNLARLSRTGTRCRLENTVAYRSELPWTQFLTGRPARANKYWTTVRFDPATYDAYCVGAYQDGDPFYALGPGTTVVAFDVPHAALSPRVDGLQVLAWGAHSPQHPRAARPAGLLRELDREVGRHPAFNNDNDLGWYEPDYLNNLTEALVVGARRRIDAVAELIRRAPDWDLLVTVMSESHSIGHHTWHGVDAAHPLHDAGTAALARQRLLEVYRALDEAVGRFAALVPADAALAVFALHGMQHNENDLPSVVLLPELLHRLQFGRPRFRQPDAAAWRAAGMPLVLPARNEVWADYMQRRFDDRVRDRVRNRLAEHAPGVLERVQRLRGRPPSWPLGVLGAPVPDETDLSPEEIRNRRESLAWQPTTWYRRHWPKMPAFVLPTFSDGHVRINLRGRERDGLVEPEAYEDACRRVIDEVSSCTNPRTGRTVVADVHWMRKDDPFDPEGPDADLVILWTEPMDAFEHPVLGTIGPYPYMRTGEHSSNGFMLLSGPSVPDADLGTRSAFDVTPTLLHLLGRPVPQEMVGSSLVPAPVTGSRGRR